VELSLSGAAWGPGLNWSVERSREKMVARPSEAEEMDAVQRTCRFGWVVMQKVQAVEDDPKVVDAVCVAASSGDAAVGELTPLEEATCRRRHHHRRRLHSCHESPQVLCVRGVVHTMYH
jgi:hypothetical protein